MYNIWRRHRYNAVVFGGDGGVGRVAAKSSQHVKVPVSVVYTSVRTTRANGSLSSCDRTTTMMPRPRFKAAVAAVAAHMCVI